MLNIFLHIGIGFFLGLFALMLASLIIGERNSVGLNKLVKLCIVLLGVLIIVILSLSYSVSYWYLLTFVPILIIGPSIYLGNDSKSSTTKRENSNVVPANKTGFNLSMFLGDTVRWLVALALLPIFLWLIFLFFVYPFEWLLYISTEWTFIIHLLFWLLIGSMIVGFFTSISSIIALLSIYVVRQSLVYTALFSIALILLVIVATGGIWFNYVEFSWQFLPYETFNKILFTVLILSLLKIPLVMIDASYENSA